MTSLVLRAISRGHIKIIIILFFLNSTALATGCDGMLHDFEDADLTEWRDCGGSSWYIDSSIGHDSKFSLRSGPIDCTGISRICREVKGPAEVTFWWQCEPLRQGIAELTFAADDTRRVCDSSEWSPISYTVRDNNTHQLIWEFRKIKCYPKNAGAGWIDDVCISSETPTIPSEIKRGNISGANMSSDARVISSGVIVELSNFTIVANEVTMETTNVTINPSGDILINPNEVNISPDKVSMNASEVVMAPTKVVMGNVTMNASGDVLINPHEVAISSDEVTMDNSDVAISASEVIVEAKGVTSVMLNTSANTTTSAVPVTRSINVTVDSILSPVRTISLQDERPSVDLMWPNSSGKFFVGTQIDFKFKPVDDGELKKCSLYINCSEVNSSTRINSGEECIITHSINDSGYYKWYVVCEDESYQSNASDKWSISIQPTTVYVDKNKTKNNRDESVIRYYNGIQEAINDVVENTTIIVEPNQYKENIIINKSINLRGNSTLLFNNRPAVIGTVEICSDDVEFEGFELNATSNSYGIYITNDFSMLSGINISNNAIKGYAAGGIYLEKCHDVTIHNNSLDDYFPTGEPKHIHLIECNRCNIINNIINKHIQNDKKEYTVGVKLDTSSNILVEFNEMCRVSYGIYCVNSKCNITNRNACDTGNTFGEQVYEPCSEHC
ncbi:MAG TPA: hypothetical protein PLY09_07385 [Methanothrix sp.]|nr:hypothetical protein [Methanothrix sp.]